MAAVIDVGRKMSHSLYSESKYLTSAFSLSVIAEKDAEMRNAQAAFLHEKNRPFPRPSQHVKVSPSPSLSIQKGGWDEWGFNLDVKHPIYLPLPLSRFYCFPFGKRLHFGHSFFSGKSGGARARLLSLG